MKLLVLGGTRFVGRVLVEEALRRGHEITVFNRGRTGTDVPDAEVIRGDRELPADLDRLRQDRSWDAVIDTSGYVPGVVGDNARALADHVSQYVFVSTVSAYADWPHAGVSEESPLQECPSDIRDSAANQADWPPGRYGSYKAGCERALREAFGEKLLILRPGVVLGPHEDVGRLPWWLHRAAKGGRMLAPGDPGRGLQPIDARDLTAFALDCIEQERTGVFNTAAPRDHTTYGSVIDTCIKATGSGAEPVWVDDEFLLAHDVRQWTELPLWRISPGTWEMATKAAASAGLICRPMEQTVRDTWAWLSHGDGSAFSRRASRHGMDADKEQRILAAWEAQRSRA